MKQERKSKMTTFAGEFAFGCSEDFCVIFIHKVVITTVDEISIKSPVHQRADGTYYYDAPDKNGNFVRKELER